MSHKASYVRLVEDKIGWYTAQREQLLGRYRCSTEQVRLEHYTGCIERLQALKLELISEAVAERLGASDDS
jgi:hypothetical protein